MLVLGKEHKIKPFFQLMEEHSLLSRLEQLEEDVRTFQNPEVTEKKEVEVLSKDWDELRSVIFVAPDNVPKLDELNMGEVRKIKVSFFMRDLIVAKPDA